MSLGRGLIYLMSLNIAVCDTCFLIDWARYRHRDIFFKLFKVVYVSEDVLKEIVSEDTLQFVANAMIKRSLVLFNTY